MVRENEPSPRDLEIYAQVCAGRTQQAVGDAIGLSRQRIHVIVRQVEAWLAPQMMEQIREVKARHTTSLEHVFREAMAAWEKSKQDQLKFRTGSTAQGEIEETTRTQTCGDPRFLDAAMKALEQIRKMWGANAPVANNTGSGLRFAGKDPDQAIRDYAEQKIEHYRRMMGTASEN